MDRAVADVLDLLFLSTPSARRATCCRVRRGRSRKFLSTPSARRATRLFGDFFHSVQFLSTPSARRATRDRRGLLSLLPISIHALREEGDGGRQRRVPALLYFYPRPPRGGRRVLGPARGRVGPFLSTPSARRATEVGSLIGRAQEISIHALREEGDSKNRDKISIFKQIIQHSARI